MKTNTLLSAIIIFIVFFSACKKKDVDETQPELTLKGKSLDWVYYPKTYVDPGVTATDDKDGDVSANVVVTNSIDYTHPDITYNIDYIVNDAAGNASNNAVRLVMLINLTDGFEGVAGNVTWIDSVVYFVGDSLRFNQFAGYTNAHITAKLTNDTVFTIASQTVTCGAPAVARTFSGSGTISHARSGPSIRSTMNLTYAKVEAGVTTNGTMTFKN